MFILNLLRLFFRDYVNHVYFMIQDVNILNNINL
jgi:hypothetical protein